MTCPGAGPAVGSQLTACPRAQINLHQLMELKAAFDRADTDGGGSLDLEEFLEVRHSPSTRVSAGSR